MVATDFPCLYVVCIVSLSLYVFIYVLLIIPDVIILYIILNK